MTIIQSIALSISVFSIVPFVWLLLACISMKMNGAELKSNKAYSRANLLANVFFVLSISGLAVFYIAEIWA